MQKYSIELSKIQEILQENPDGMTVQDISKKININRNSVAKYLDVLHIAGNATMKKIGPAKVFFPSKRVNIENIMNCSTDLFIVINSKTEIVDVNDKFTQFIEKTREEVLNLKLNDIQMRCAFSKEEMKAIEKSIEKALSGEQTITEIHCQKKRWYKAKFIPTRIDENNIGVTIILENITERKEAAEKLAKINNELTEERKLFVKGPVAIFKWMNEENWPIEYASENIKNITGYSAEEFKEGKIKYVNLIHKDDFLKVSYESRMHERNGSEQFEHKPYRIITKNKEEKWVSVHTTIIRNENKQITHFLCYLIDITNLLNTTKVIEEKKNK